MTFEEDKLGRKKYAEFLTEIISNPEKYKRKSDSDSFSIAIDSGWGTGKTTFIEMWTNELENIKDENENFVFNIINFNAWKNDFSQNAFASIVYSILNSDIFNDLKSQDGGKNALQKLAIYGGKLIMSAVKVGIRCTAGPEFADIAGDAFDEFSENGIKGLKEIIDTSNSLNKRILDFYQEYETYYQAINEIKEALQYVVKEKPLLIIIDELDRCKPLFAIELLESVKHIFDVKNIIFVFALDMDQLSHSIRCVYGEGMDACGYLCRFFDYISKMPVPDMQKYANYLFEEKPLINTNPTTYYTDFSTNRNISILNLLSDMAVNLKLSLRDFNTIYHNYLLFEEIELKDIKSREAYILYWFLLILKYKYTDEFNNIFLKNNISFEKHAFIISMLKDNNYIFILEALEQIVKNQRIDDLSYTLYNKNQISENIKIRKFEYTNGGIVYTKMENVLTNRENAYLFGEDSNLSNCLFQNDLKKWESIKEKYINAYIEEKLEFFDFSFENRNESEGGNVNENDEFKLIAFNKRDEENFNE